MTPHFGVCISIHLMLLFNKIIDSLQMVLIHFNTSNVTIQQHHETMGYDSEYISIHLMLLFNVFSNFIIHFLLYFNTSNVTIQLYTIPVCRYLWRISIHLMLLFNQNLEPFIELIRNISIHLMLLFNFIEHKLWWTDIEFQYI